MKKLFFLIAAIIFISFTNINAQDLLRVDEVEIVNAQTNNVTVQIKIVEEGQTVLNRVDQSNVNTKAGFDAQFNADNTLLTLNFTKPFTESELNILLKYAGVELKRADFYQLSNLLNQ